MKRYFLFVMLCVLAVTQARAVINIYTITGGNGGNGIKYGNNYDDIAGGFGIYGWENAGDIAKLLNGEYDGTVYLDGQVVSASSVISNLANAVGVKLGGDETPEALNDADLAALVKLTSAKYIDMDKATIADGANLSSIKAGSSIKAVSLPDGLTKEQVNAAGAALAACNSGFSSCVSQSYGTTTIPQTYYVYGNPETEYMGNVTDVNGVKQGTVQETATVNLTLVDGFPKYSYSVNNVKCYIENAEDIAKISNGQYTPDEVPVQLTTTTTITYESNGTTYSPPTWVNLGYVHYDETTGKYYFNDGVWFDGGDGGRDHSGEECNVSSTYTYWDNATNSSQPYTDVDKVISQNGNNYGFIPNTNNSSYQVSMDYMYSYELNNETKYIGPQQSEIQNLENYEVSYDVTVTLTEKTREVSTTTSNVTAYVNTAGSLQEANYVAGVDSKNVEKVILSGNITLNDLAGNGLADPLPQTWDGSITDTKWETPGYPASANQAWNTTGATKNIKSFDLSDAHIDNEKYLRILRNFEEIEEVIFPTDVINIPQGCLAERNKCSHIVLPPNVETIGVHAFNSVAITELVLPSTLTSVGAFAFANCASLTDVEMKALENDCTFGAHAFSACGKLKHVTLSEKVQNISDCMFNQCLLLESVRVPSTCKTIGERAFYECRDMHSITIPEGVEEILTQAFELSGLTDIYVMAKSPCTVPKIYAMPANGSDNSKSTFTSQRTTGNNTVPDTSSHLSEFAKNPVEVGYDEVVGSWYQAEMSGQQGLGSGNSLLALHYPDEMKWFYEGINVNDLCPEGMDLSCVPGVKDAEDDGWVDYVTGEGHNGVTKAQVVQKIHGGDSSTDGPFKYLPQAYSIKPDGYHNALMGPDKDGYYYPNVSDYAMRMAAGYYDPNQLSAWGWRQFPLSVSIGDAGYEYFEKEYTRTWYTMCFPWHMEDEQLFQAFEQKLEMVEFVGAEMLNAGTTKDEKGNEEVSYNLVFHFDKVVDTYYIDEEGREYDREPDIDPNTGQQRTRLINGEQRRLWKYINQADQTDVVTYPEVIPDPKAQSSPEVDALRTQYGRYLSVKNIMGLAGHPYMIHPAIGTPQEPAKAIINGIKRKYRTDWEDQTWSAENQKQARTVGTLEKDEWEGIINDETKGIEVPQAKVFQSPLLGAGEECKFVFIGNIDDYDATNDKIVSTLKKEMPVDDYHVVYYLGLAAGQTYPKYYRKTAKGTGKWSVYTAVIVPDANAYAGIEQLRGYKEAIPVEGAKAASITFGEWTIVTPTAIKEIIADAERKGEKVQKGHLNVVYNINGQIVREGVPSVEGLPSGMYIVNGKKYMVK